MAFVNEIQAKCCRCSKPHTLSVYGSINVSENPELKDKVKDGSLFLWECEDCGALNLIKSETLYHDPEKRLMLWLTPEDKPSLGEKMDTLGKELRAYTLRRVLDTGSLIEKVNIFDAGLDDMVVEMCKYVTKMELCEKAGTDTAQITDAAFKFYKMRGADNELVFSFPMDGKMQGVTVGFNVYEDCTGIIGRNKSISESVRGFARVDSEWLSQFFK